MSAEFWEEQCPARGAGLSHAHWNKCDPNGTHPRRAGELHPGRKHAADQCCECEHTALTWARLQDAEAEAERTRYRRVTQDHPFRFTIGGCYYCGKPEDVHPVFLPVELRKEGECVADHDSIMSGLLINDGGLERRRCPVCTTQLEPRLAEGYPKGPSYGPGRMPWTKRRWDMIVRIKDAFDGGYYKS